MPKKDESSPPKDVEHTSRSSDAFGDTEMGRRVAAFDWAGTGLGTLASWPQSLRTVVNLALRSSVPMMLLWGKDGIMVYNDAYAVLTGKKHPGILGLPVLEGWPELADFASYVMEKALAGKSLTYKDQPLTVERNGRTEQIWVDLDYTPVSDDANAPAGVLSIITETSERVQAERSRKRAEEALETERDQLRTLLGQQEQALKKVEASEERQRVIVETLEEGVMMIAADGTIISANKSAERLLGLTLDQLRGRTSLDPRWRSVYEDGSPMPGSEHAPQHVLRTKKPYVNQVIGIHKPDGSLVWLTGNARPILRDGELTGVVASFFDITKRKCVEEELRASEARFRFVTESLPQHVWTATPDGKIDYVNKHTLDYFQKPSEVFLEEGWQSVLHPDDLQSTLEARAHSLTAGGIFEKEFRLRRASDHSYRWHLSRALPVYDEQHNIIKWFGSNTDIQEIKSATKRRDELERIADALREQRAELMALNRSKDEFISLASHQLRTPATGVKQYVGMVLEGFGGDLTEEQRQFLTSAYESNERQLAIVNELLKVARIDSGKVSLKPSGVSLVPLITAILDEQASEFAFKRQTVSFRHRGTDYHAWGDKDLLRMVLENLIDNARKYSYEGKTITITLTKPKGAVRVDVHDEGVGIAAKDIEKLGQKFTRLDNPLSAQSGGTGLGLYWAQKIIKLHEGELLISSEKRRGSTFSIILKQSKGRA